MEIRITGASAFVNRMFEACGNYQWAREFLRNSLEADATKVEFGIEWQAVEKLGTYRRTIIDNGFGMGPEELEQFFSTLGAGAKKIGGIHDNFGVGGKIASLPWNPEGVVVISYKANRGSMIWIVLNEESGNYELVDFKRDGSLSCVIEPQRLDELDPKDIDWAAIRPDWLTEHGTIVVLLGSEEYPDTVLGNPAAGERDIKGLSVYLNSRFWDLSEFEVTVAELRNEKKAKWPTARDDRDDSRRPNNRTIRGARPYLTEAAKTGKPADQDVLLLDDGRVAAEWYLWEGDRPMIHSYAKRLGYIAVRYRDELFELTAHKSHFRWFGIVESKVQQNLTIILEPEIHRASNGRWGIHPDQSRNRLSFTGSGEKGVALPLSDWGLEFAENMPEPIRRAILTARGELTGSIQDGEYRKRLQDKFGSRWTVKSFVKAGPRDTDRQPGASGDTEVEIIDRPDPSDAEGTRKRRRTKTVKVIRKKSQPEGAEEGTERETPVDVPRYRFAHSDEFEKPWHLALWSPNDPEGPTVMVNVGSPILQEIVEHHQAQYPDVYAEEIATTVHQVFGEIATCKVAHSQKLSRNVPLEQLDREYRSEEALTLALMGLLAEESVIAQRLGKLGRKKSVA